MEGDATTSVDEYCLAIAVRPGWRTRQPSLGSYRKYTVNGTSSSGTDPEEPPGSHGFEVHFRCGEAYVAWALGRDGSVRRYHAASSAAGAALALTVRAV